jgi:hypothetical protein
MLQAPDPEIWEENFLISAQCHVRGVDLGYE